MFKSLEYTLSKHIVFYQSNLKNNIAVAWNMFTKIEHLLCQIFGYVLCNILYGGLQSSSKGVIRPPIGLLRQLACATYIYLQQTSGTWKVGS